MKPQRGSIDEEEEIRWIVERSKKLGEPLGEDLVKRVLLLQQAFELEIGNAVIVTRPCGEPAIICMGQDTEDMWENPVCALCMLAVGMPPPHGDGAGQTPEQDARAFNPRESWPSVRTWKCATGT